MMKSVHPSSKQAKDLFAGLTTLVGWVVTCSLGILAIFDVRDIVLGVYLRFFAPAVEATFLQGLSSGLATWSMFLWAIILVIYIFGSGEYAYRHFGRPRVLRLFAWALSVEVIIIAVGWFF
jgi:hypothetical protein